MTYYMVRISDIHRLTIRVSSESTAPIRLSALADLRTHCGQQRLNSSCQLAGWTVIQSLQLSTKRVAKHAHVHLGRHVIQSEILQCRPSFHRRSDVIPWQIDSEDSEDFWRYPGIVEKCGHDAIR